VPSYRHITQRLKLDSFTPSTGCVNINKTTHKKARYEVKRVGQASGSYWVSTLNSRKHGANQFQKNALHRIPIIPKDVPIQFKRLQFPIRLAFAMTINKSQGQTMSICGLDLSTPCFSHGQLYVACSREGKPFQFVCVS
jgi:ATP-dependent exoDNAse (exonuclease V) alpha subunit